MKSPEVIPLGSRIASVHNGSSLFTGDAGGGESNIRRYLIENDWLEAIIQLPNNLFYNTGITTYIWLLSNRKPAHRRGKVQLIDAGQLYRKLRKNLGAKNCELSPEHIAEIMRVHAELAAVERTGEEGLASKVFDNRDFGYYKVTIERPKRLKAQFTPERIAELRFDSRLREPMAWAWETFGERVYEDLKSLEKEIVDYAEKQDLNLNKKQLETLTKTETWQKQRGLMELALKLMQTLGTDESTDFNAFALAVELELKGLSTKLSAGEKKQMLDAVSWYDADAEKVKKGIKKFRNNELDLLLQRLGCTPDQLPDFGYYTTAKANEYLEYETESDLRDTENVPLGEGIHAYFGREVQPHVPEAWINLDATKIGYEISFNKYFYRHKPLRSLEEVSADILQLEEESEGLIRNLLTLA